jgi:hypothetical protein
MKPRLFLPLLLATTISFSSFANTTSHTEPASRVVSLKEKYTSMVIESDLAVVLTESNSTEIVLKGNERDIKKVRVKVQDGNLILTSLDYIIKPDVTIYVPANLLTRINVNGKARLSSDNTLSNEKLKVVIADEATVNLRSQGKVIVEGTSEIDFVTGK